MPWKFSEQRMREKRKDEAVIITASTPEEHQGLPKLVMSSKTHMLRKGIISCHPNKVLCLEKKQ